MADVVTAPVITIAADGAIPIPSDLREVFYLFNKAGALALTIGAPTAGVDDGKKITFLNNTANAHVVTQGTVGFNAKGAAGTLTWAAAKGGAISIVAQNGNWYTTTGAVGGVTVA